MTDSRNAQGAAMDTHAEAVATPLLNSEMDGVIFLTLNRPKQFNALSLAVLHALHEIGRAHV